MRFCGDGCGLNLGDQASPTPRRGQPVTIEIPSRFRRLITIRFPSPRWTIVGHQWSRHERDCAAAYSVKVTKRSGPCEVPQQKWTSEIAGRWSPGRMCVCLVVGVRLPRSIG